MQTATELYQDLQARGFHFEYAEDKLRVIPRAKLSAEDVNAITAHKAGLLAILEPPYVRPHLTPEGEIRISFNSHPRFQYWKLGSQSLWATLAELNAPLASWQRYAQQQPLTDACNGCTKPVGKAEGFVYCVACGFYREQEAAND